MFKNIISFRSHWLLAIVLPLLLVACGGGGGGSSTSTTETKNISITPGLGGFSAGAVVEAYKPNGDLIKASTTNAAGEATLDMYGYDGPFILKVSGATGVTYYDEKTGTSKDFSSSSDYLLSVVPTTAITSGSSYGVTPLTNMAAALAGVDGLAPMISGATSAAVISSINQSLEYVQSLMGVDSTTLNILSAPTLVRADRTTVSGGNSAGVYGLLLAELANQSTSTTPLVQAKSMYTRALKVKQSAFTSGLTDLDTALAPLKLAQAKLSTGTTSFLSSGSKVALTYTDKTASQVNTASTITKATTAARTINVVPGSGAFGSGAKVSVINPSTGSEISFASTNASGVAVVDLGTYSGPMVLRVSGGAGVKYYDETLGASVDFDSSKSMLSVVPAESVTSGSSYGISPLTHLAAVFAGLTASNFQVTKPTGGTESDTMYKALARVRLLLGFRSDTSNVVNNIHTLNLLIAPSVLSSTTASAGIDLSAPGGYMGYFLAEIARASRSRSSSNAIEFSERLAAAGLKLKTAIDGGNDVAITAAVAEFSGSAELGVLNAASAQVAVGSNKFIKSCITVDSSSKIYLANMFSKATDLANLNPSASKLAEMVLNLEAAVLQQTMNNSYTLSKTSTCTS